MTHDAEPVFELLLRHRASHKSKLVPDVDESAGEGSSRKEIRAKVGSVQRTLAFDLRQGLGLRRRGILNTVGFVEDQYDFLMTAGLEERVKERSKGDSFGAGIPLINRLVIYYEELSRGFVDVVDGRFPSEDTERLRELPAPLLPRARSLGRLAGLGLLRDDKDLIGVENFGEGESLNRFSKLCP